MLKKYNELNRALIKRCELLPNVFEFSTKKYGIHEYAAIYGIEKIIRRCTATKLLKSQPNFYIERCHKRLVTYAANGQIAEFNNLSEIMLRKSVSYRILALNRTNKDWFQIPIRNLRRMWRSLSLICSTLSSDLRTKRVWIDKKPDDYARPLTVPTPAWRSFSWMRMDHFEKFFKASGLLQPWQHGGRSGVGVLSCYRQLIPRLKESNTIFEFDIKGFFDNISHESIIKRFKETIGSTKSTWIGNILKSSPSSYVLPPEEKDIALQRYKASISQPGFSVLSSKSYSIMSTFLRGAVRLERNPPMDLINAAMADKARNNALEPHPMITGEVSNYRKESYAKAFEAGRKIDRSEMIAAAMADKARNRALELEESIYENREITLKDSYKTLMTEEKLDMRSKVSDLVMADHSQPSEEDRAKGRDNWKNLGQPGKGVPQGLGTSPFISTFLTDTYLYELGTDLKALIMYMDDGILFARSKVEMERYIKRLKELLGALGLELAEDKSRYAKIDGVWQGSIKFLGLRYLPESDTLMSDTRSGTQVIFPSKSSWEDIKDMAALNSLSIPYMRKIFDKLINTQAYETGLKHGFLGCLIAGSQYKDALPMEERKQEIRKGQASAWAKVENSSGFIWKAQDLINHTEYLTNVSSIACHRFAEFNRKGRKLFISKRNKAGKPSRLQRV